MSSRSVYGKDRYTINSHINNITQFLPHYVYILFRLSYSYYIDQNHSTSLAINRYGTPEQFICVHMQVKDSQNINNTKLLRNYIRYQQIRSKNGQ